MEGELVTDMGIKNPTVFQLISRDRYGYVGLRKGETRLEFNDRRYWIFAEFVQL